MKHHRALIIGVGADLPMTVTGAKGLPSIFGDPSRCNIALVNVRVLTGSDATRDTIGLR